jgi:hypothetical protein
LQKSKKNIYRYSGNEKKSLSEKIVEMQCVLDENVNQHDNEHMEFDI